jgi:hypothetical protein
VLGKFRKWVDRAIDWLLNDMNERLAQEMRSVCSVPAPIRVSRSGRAYAITPATPGAPPRMVTGNLYRSIRTIRSPLRVAKWVLVGMFYGEILQKSHHASGFPHRFLEPALDRIANIRSYSGRTYTVKWGRERPS